MHFELRRRLDGLTYRFARAEREDGRVGYRRQDTELWIVRCARQGWIAIDPDSDAVTERPWHVEPQDQGEVPPAGVWVSSKGDKAYVYDLVHIDPPGASSSKAT